MTLSGTLDRLFRHSSGRILATLVRALGPERLELAEDCLADALEQALRTWPISGVPGNPEGWLFRAARNRALDVVRRERTLCAKLPLLTELNWDDQRLARDGELALMFLCCHPALPRPSQVALTLKIVGGLGVREIATALLAKETTIAQRLVRAKKALRDTELSLPVESRLDSVLDVLYLLFNEGYQATSGELVVRRELCGEAIRLARLVVADPRTDLPRVRALLALMLLQASRLPARTGAAGELLLIDEQDRGRWDHALVEEGTAVFERACTGPELSSFHVEAAIALCHTESPPDWRQIVRCYDDLLLVRPSPVARLNRAVALAMLEGPGAGIAELDRLAAEPSLAGHLALPAALGALALRAGDQEQAARHYTRALTLPCSEPQRRFFEERLAICRSVLP